MIYNKNISANNTGLLWLYLLGFGMMALSMEPGYLDFDNLPDTNFSCVGKVIGGYYADLETNCQMFHVCTIGQLDEPMDIRFLCLNGTVFDQETRVCERIDEVDCSKSEKFYSLNLELYGNTQPSILEENPETDPPIIIKSTTTTTTTTTTTPRPKTTRPPYFTTSIPTVTTLTSAKVISTHHFPISNQASDIRFNPEEINISLNPGAPPNIRGKPVSFQEQIFETSDGISHNNNKKAILTTHTTNFGSENREHLVQVLPKLNTPLPLVSTTTQKSKIYDKVTPADINYGFTYHQTESNQEFGRTESPAHRNYQYHYRPGQFRNQFKTSTYRTELTTTHRSPYNSHSGPTTFKNPYLSSLKPPSFHTEKPQRLQLPLPLLPTLPPLQFSSPAPFSLSRHIETKRYTQNDHQTPPRIIISASASVSDASGRRLNYSLGTIGVSPLLEEPPKSYDDYKEHDVGLDPFYHDVPKVKLKRGKRSPQNSGLKHSDVIRNEQEAVDVLKFLFDWYKNHEKSTTVAIPVSPEDITEINDKLMIAIVEESTLAENVNSDNDTQEEIPLIAKDENFRESALFQRKSKFNIVGDVLSVTEKPEEEILTSNPPPISLELKQGSDDYVDDNYEPLTFEEKKNHTEDRATNYKIYKNYTEESESETETEQTTFQEIETSTTTTTTTTTPRPSVNKSGRRGRSRFRSTSQYKQTNYKDDKRPKVSNSRRRGRGRYNSLEDKSTTIIPQNHEEVLTTLPVLNIETTTPIQDSASDNTLTETETLPPEESTTLMPKSSSTSELNSLDFSEGDVDEATQQIELPKEENNFSHEDNALSERKPIDDYDNETEITTLSAANMESDLENINNENDYPNIETSSENIETTIATTLSIEKLSTVLETDIGDVLSDLTSTARMQTEEETTVPLEESTEAQTTTEENIESTTESEFNLTSAESITDEIATVPITSERPVTSTVRSYSRRTRPARQRANSRHRFSTELFTARPSRRKPIIEEEIIEALTGHLTTTDTNLIRINTNPELNLTTSILDKNVETSSSTLKEEYAEDVPATDAPLYKSANPTTQAEDNKDSIKDLLSTTPMMYNKVEVRTERVKSFIFNCFGRVINKFYSDPRDCRLFHYCTSGYTKNQLLDMKFVCDLGTYFDDQKLICTKTKPERCL